LGAKVTTDKLMAGLDIGSRSIELVLLEVIL